MFLTTLQVPTLAKSMLIAGDVGSSSLPASAGATKEGTPDAPFTVIGNAGALHMAKED